MLIIQVNGVQVIFVLLIGDILLDVLIGVMFVIISYFSFAVVLLIVILIVVGIIFFFVVFCLVIGVNFGFGLLVMFNNSVVNVAVCCVVLGSLLFKLVGSLIILLFVYLLVEIMGKLLLLKVELVIYFYVFYNFVCCLVMLLFVDLMVWFCKMIICDELELDIQLWFKYLDVSVLDMFMFVLVNVVCEILCIGDVMEQMMEGLNKVMYGELWQEKELCKLVDDINVFYIVIKLYLVWMLKEELVEEELCCWVEIIEMLFNFEQVFDIVECMGSEIVDKLLAVWWVFLFDGLKELDVFYE